MSIKTYLEHRQLMRLIAVLLTILMLYSCFSLCMIDAEALAGEIAISLIALILAGFGIVASTTGAIDGMNQGLESLMGEYSESQGHETGWFRGLFNTENIIMKGYNRLGVSGFLVAYIRLFIEWLRAEKGLSETAPIEVGYSPASIVLGNYRLPVNLKIYEDGRPVPTLNAVYVAPEYTVQLEENSPYYVYDGKSYGYQIRPYGNKGRYEIVAPNGSKLSHVVNYESALMALFYVDGYILFTQYWAEQSWYVDPQSGTNVNRIQVNESQILPASSGWQVEDNNLDTSYLDNEDDSTKDVIFTPSYPADMPLDDLDLGTIGGMEDAADRSLEYTQTETGTAVGEGEITTESNLQPGDNEVPDISIPSGGFFSTIWHYVVEALQVSRNGISFILNIVNTVIPPSILILCWASCVLLIVFGILNKFLK